MRYSLSVVILMTSLLPQQSAGFLIKNNCRTMSPFSNPAFVGWPHRIRCNLAIFESYFYNVVDLLAQEINCSVLSSDGVVLFHEPILFDDLNYDDDFGLLLNDVRSHSNLTYYIMLTMSNQECFIKPILITPTILPNLSCQTYQQHKQGTPSRVTVGQRLLSKCQVDLSEEPRLDFNSNSSDVIFRWFKSCDNQLPHGMAMNQHNELVSNKITFEMDGLYVCAATHNNMTRHVRSIQLCVQNRRVLKQPTIKCKESNFLALLGSDLSVNCSLDLGWGPVNMLDFSIFLEREDKRILCLPFTSSNRSQLSCSFSEINSSCYSKFPSIEERRIQQSVIPFIIIIGSA